MMGKANRDRAGARIQINLCKRSCKCVWTGVSTLLSGAGKIEAEPPSTHPCGGPGAYHKLPVPRRINRMIKAENRYGNAF